MPITTASGAFVILPIDGDRGLPPDDSNIVTPISISQESGSFEKDFACVGKSYSTRRNGKPAALRNREQIDRLVATTELLNQGGRYLRATKTSAICNI